MNQSNMIRCIWIVGLTLLSGCIDDPSYSSVEGQEEIVSTSVPTPPRLPADVEGVCQGMTWAARRVAGDYTMVGSDGFTDPYVGDASCNVTIPILCLRHNDQPPPSFVDPNDFYHGWSGADIALTAPISGLELGALEVADGLCRANFGEGWRMAEFHDGNGGWNWWGLGRIDVTTRFWVHINDQPGNPWD